MILKWIDFLSKDKDAVKNVARALVRNGIDFNIKDYSNKTAADLIDSAIPGKKHVEKHLLKIL